MARWKIRITFTSGEERCRRAAAQFEGVVHSATWEGAAAIVFRREAAWRGERESFVPVVSRQVTASSFEVRFGYPAAGSAVLGPACLVEFERLSRGPASHP